MTLEEAIRHCEEVAKSCQLKAYDIERDDYKDLEECAAEHRQLVEWLRELKRLRAQNPCDDAVSREAVYEAMVEKGQHSRRYKVGEIWELNGDEIREALDMVPSVTPKRKTGKWLCSDDLYETAVCSCCGWDTTEPWQHIKSWFEFCPHCGADMRGEQDE